MKLTTYDTWKLNEACKLIEKAFDCYPYLVGTAGAERDGTSYRDVDVRLILFDEDFDRIFTNKHIWELFSLSITAYLQNVTGLPIDFQIQRMSEANENHKGHRNALGMDINTFAGGGDGTPDWDNRNKNVNESTV